jgi:seryl-tRNA synthetase
VKGHIALPWSTVYPSEETRSKSDFCFVLCPRIIEKKKKNYYLSAASKAEMEEWITAIENAAALIPTAEEVLRGNYKLLDPPKENPLKRTRTETRLRI